MIRTASRCSQESPGAKAKSLKALIAQTQQQVVLPHRRTIELSLRTPLANGEGGDLVQARASDGSYLVTGGFDLDFQVEVPAKVSSLDRVAGARFELATFGL
jgi:hypothetical protein